MASTNVEFRQKVKIAIICALTIEASMVESLMTDIRRPGPGKARGDDNNYIVGVMSDHNVVVAYLARAGSNHASIVAAHLPLSFQNIEIIFVVGICGVVPIHPESKKEIVLGDCILSTGLTQTDIGQRYDTGFRCKTGLDDVLPRAPPRIQSFVNKLQSESNQEWIAEELRKNLITLQQKRSNARYPISSRDRLYKAEYSHKHQYDGELCSQCLPKFNTCQRHCTDLKCSDEALVQRSRLDAQEPIPPQPKIHFGRFGTANHILRSGRERDEFAATDSIVAFEMEGSGIWENLNTMILKSACDYADAHKNKDFQLYAAATAAATLKSVLVLWDKTDEEQDSTQTASNDAYGTNVSGKRTGNDGRSISAKKYYEVGSIETAVFY